MALGSIPVTLVESGGISRAGADRTLASMRFPIPVPLRQDEAKTSTAAFRFMDTVTSTAAAASMRPGLSVMEGGARWGDIGTAGHALKCVLVDVLPSISANETRAFQFQTSGGSGDTTGGITVSAQAAYYEINTGNPGITLRVPRTGPQCVISYAKDNATNREIVNGTQSGLWIRGISADGQAADYFSSHDTTDTSADNGGSGTETSRPGRYYTSILSQRSQRVHVKIDNIRMKTAGGAAEFAGKRREYGSNGTPTTQVVVCDVYLTFYRNSRAVRLQIVNKSSGGDSDNNPGLRSDCAIDGFGFDLVPTFSGSATKLATRDETAAAKIARAAAGASDTTLRQLSAKVQQSTYNFSLSKTSPITFTGSPVTQLEAVFDVTQSDDSRGVLIAPWAWRERNPMGWHYAPSTGRLRWEILNPEHGEVTTVGTSTTPMRDYHVLTGHQWLYAEAFLVFHAGAISDADLTTTVRALMGRHVNQENGVYVPSTETGPGAQIPTLLGSCDVAHWNDTRAWSQLPPPWFDLPGNLGQPGLKGLASTFAGTGATTIFGDAMTNFDRWIDTYIDAAAVTDAEPNKKSFRGREAVPIVNWSSGGQTLGPIGYWDWRYYGCHPTSGSTVGANDYEYCGYLLTHFLRRRNPGHFMVGWESVMHCATIDQAHNFYGTDAGGLRHGLLAGFSNPSNFHYGNNSAGIEFQQHFYAIPWWWLHTAEPVLYESMQHYVNWVNNYLYGATGSGFSDWKNRGITTGTADGTTTLKNVADTSQFVPGPESSVEVYPGVVYPINGGGLLTSSGARFTNTVDFPALGFPGHAVMSNSGRGGWPGVLIRAPRTTGQTYKVTWINSATTIDVVPTPPALTDVDWEFLYRPSDSRGGTLTGKTATTLTCTWPFGTPNSTGTVQIRAGYSKASRRDAHPMLALVGMARCLGQTITNAQGTHNLYARVRDGALYLEHSEQWWASDAAKAQMGGIGTWTPAVVEAPQFVVAGHGNYGWTGHTYSLYPIYPLINAHELMAWCAANGYSGVVSAAQAMTVLNLLDRMARFNFLGVNGTTRLMGATFEDRKLPQMRGGVLASPTSYQRLWHPFNFCPVEEPARATRTGLDFLHTAEDLNALSTLAFSASSGFTSGTTASSGVMQGADLLTYVAEKKWNAVNNTLRDAYFAMALECFINTKIYEIPSTQPGPGAFIDPTILRRVSTQIGANGAAEGGIRLKHWLLKSNGYALPRLQQGWGGGTPDTQAPTETQLLALVSRTDTSITVNGPAATDNVAVVDYLFFKDGVQDGPAQTSTQHTYSGLTANTTYSLKRKARDAVPNTSGDSNTLSIATLAAVDTDPPSVPVINTPRTLGPDSITYTWPASTDATGIRRYLFSFDGGADVEVLAPTTTYTALGLTPGTLHTGKVRAEDNAATPGNVSAYSTTVSDTTPTADTDPPSQPGPPELGVRTSTSLAVDWAPSIDNVAVQDYVVTAGSEPPVTVTAPPATIPNLTPWTPYPVSVVARDAALNVSDASPVAEFTTLRLARSFLASSGQVCRATVLPAISDYPLTVGISVYPTLSATGFIWSMANHLTNTDYLVIKAQLVGGILKAHVTRSSAAGTAAGASSAATLALNVWQRIIAVFASATACSVRLSGDAKVTDTSQVAFPAGLSRLTVGGLDRLSPVQWYTGRAADLAIWSAALDEVEQTAFLSGTLPWLLRRDSLVTHHLLHGESPEPDLIGSSDLTVVGATTADGPEYDAALTDPTPPGDPAQVTEIVEQAVEATRISFAWDAANFAAFYRIRRLDASIVFEKPEGDRTFTAEGLLPHTEYNFTIAAVNSVGAEGPQSAHFTRRTLPLHSKTAGVRQARPIITPRT